MGELSDKVGVLNTPLNKLKDPYSSPNWSNGLQNATNKWNRIVPIKQILFHNLYAKVESGKTTFNIRFNMAAKLVDPQRYLIDPLLLSS